MTGTVNGMGKKHAWCSPETVERGLKLLAAGGEDKLGGPDSRFHLTRDREFIPDQLISHTNRSHSRMLRCLSFMFHSWFCGLKTFDGDFGDITVGKTLLRSVTMSFDSTLDSTLPPSRPLFSAKALEQWKWRPPASEE